MISRPLAARYGPLPVLAWTLAIGAPPMVLLTLPSFLAARLDAVPASVWLSMFWAIVVSSFLGWLVWSWVNNVRGLARSAPLQYLMPPISGVVAWLMLGEQFTRAQSWRAPRSPWRGWPGRSSAAGRIRAGESIVTPPDPG